MIVCSCNVLSDHDVRAVASTAIRRTTSYVYGCLGCRARCGRCASSIRKIMDEVLDEAKVGCPVGGAIHAADKRF
ncbi:MAG: (2Fe-2S)-binding protein [Pseudolabrys sp.]